MIDLFVRCRDIANKIDNGSELDARKDLILLLDACKKHSTPYTPLLNHLIRKMGLFPYMKDSAIWQDCIALNFFETDIGGDEPAVLHIDQSNILKKLLKGDNLLVSAPTSFGKSFIIDAYIASKKPNNVVIILPTVALTDETRRRLHNKFGGTYNIITQQDEEIKERNLFIFPQERAFSYLGKFPAIDILIVDEFYKASSTFRDERYASLVKIIIELKKIAAQCYFIAPDFELEPDDYPLTKGMTLLPVDRFTVYTEIHEDYKEINQNKNKAAQKETRLVELLFSGHKNLVYAGDPSNIKEVSDIVKRRLAPVNNSKLNLFSSYLIDQYGTNYRLIELIRRGVGIHDGKIHRPLAQLQIKLFSEDCGLTSVVSSSSIIEGVNTSAENVVLWSNRIAKKILSPYSYNNIIGRAGRMFKYFVGRVFLLEAPPLVVKPQLLSLEYTDEVVSSIEETDKAFELSPEQIAKIKSKEIEFNERWGKGIYQKLKFALRSKVFDIALVNEVLTEITTNRKAWNVVNISRFIDNEVSNWSFGITKSIAKFAKLPLSNTYSIIKAFSRNWELSVPEIINLMPNGANSVEAYFDYERKIAYKFTHFLSIFVSVYNSYYNEDIDITDCLSRISNVFLPKLVYQLEEYGLPRSLSKKIVNAGLIELDNPNMSLAGAIERFKEIGRNKLSASIPGKHAFEDYILEHFYSGI